LRFLKNSGLDYFGKTVLILLKSLFKAYHTSVLYGVRKTSTISENVSKLCAHTPFLRACIFLKTGTNCTLGCRWSWLVCNNPKVIERHDAKVYGKASVGSPPMSVPHLDTRMIGGKKALLFGPFAGFFTKFLKNGSFWDLPSSIEFENFLPMLAAGWHNLALTKYLVQQVAQSPEDRFEALKVYFPEAQAEDWDLAIAGQRVQVIKKDDEKVGVLEFGTELVCADDGMEKSIEANGAFTWFAD